MERETEANAAGNDVEMGYDGDVDEDKVDERRARWRAQKRKQRHDARIVRSMDGDEVNMLRGMVQRRDHTTRLLKAEIERLRAQLAVSQEERAAPRAREDSAAQHAMDVDDDDPDEQEDSEDEGEWEDEGNFIQRPNGRESVMYFFLESDRRCKLATHHSLADYRELRNVLLPYVERTTNRGQERVQIVIPETKILHELALFMDLFFCAAYPPLWLMAYIFHFPQCLVAKCLFRVSKAVARAVKDPMKSLLEHGVPSAPTPEEWREIEARTADMCNPGLEAVNCCVDGIRIETAVPSIKNDKNHVRKHLWYFTVGPRTIKGLVDIVQARTKHSDAALQALRSTKLASQMRIVVENTIGQLRHWRVLSSRFRTFERHGMYSIDVNDVLLGLIFINNRRILKTPLRAADWKPKGSSTIGGRYGYPGNPLSAKTFNNYMRNVMMEGMPAKKRGRPRADANDQ